MGEVLYFDAVYQRRCVAWERRLGQSHWRLECCERWTAFVSLHAALPLIFYIASHPWMNKRDVYMVNGAKRFNGTKT